MRARPVPGRWSGRKARCPGMAIRSLRPAWCLVLALVSLAAGTPSAKEEIRFGVEAASQGLWREALFRWERALKDYPDNARLHNNLAVAHESLGQLDQAEAQYKEAVRLDPANKDIRDNYKAFQALSRQVRERQPAPSPAVGEASPSPTPGAP